MQFVIEKASFNNAKKVNDLLTKLIIDEKFYDDENVCLLVVKTKEKKEII